MIVFQVLGAVLQPDPDIALRLFADHEREHVAAVNLGRVPLNAGEAADPRQHAAELIGLAPCHVERANAAR